MQKTPLDNWLRKRFAYRTKVLCHRIPEQLDKRVLSRGKVKERESLGSDSFQYEMVFKRAKDADQCINSLKSSNMLYSSDVVQKGGLISKFLCKSDRSVTFFVLWLVLKVIFLLALLYLLYLLSLRPEVTELLKNAWQQFRELTQ